MTRTARREGTPENRRGGAPGRVGGVSRKPASAKGGRGLTRAQQQSQRDQERNSTKKTAIRAADIYVSRAKPARKQHVTRDAQSLKSSEGEGIRLQKVLAQAGVASRRMAEKLIEQGRVEVNGRIVMEQGLRIDPNTAVVRVDGARVRVNEDMVYYVLNKPFGLQSTMSDDMGRPCVGDIVGEKLDAGQRLFHVGRLDAATGGLLLLTNDGELANRLMHPKFEVSKTYLATVIGEADRSLVRRLRDGIELEDGVAKADFVQIVDIYQGKSLLRVELHEGRKHIVRRMLKEAGFPVEQLVRTKIHTVQLAEQTPGTLRALNDSELASLYKAVGL